MARLNLRTWPVLVAAFTTLFVLIGFTGFATLRQARRLYSDVWAINQEHQRTQSLLNQVRSQIQISGILLRDHLLARSPAQATEYRDQLLAARRETLAALGELMATAHHTQADRLQRLQTAADAYWSAVVPLLNWTGEENRATSIAALRENVLPRRRAALAVAQEIVQINAAALRQQEKEVARSMMGFDSFISQTTVTALLLAILIGVVSVWRVSKLEALSIAQQQHAHEAEMEMRSLSNQIVKTQEEERRAISRELHDEVGQMLTGLRMDIAGLQKLYGAPREKFEARLEESRVLLEQTLRSVRDLAMGLRPSMLDDLGLGPALEWQAREFSRRYDIPVTVALCADLDGLPDVQRTTIYRVVQEALTNCARHSRAAAVDITLRESAGHLQVEVSDDGIGVSGQHSPGLGLLGIQERVKAIGGGASVEHRLPRGTIVRAEIPLPGSAAAHA